MSKQTHYCEKCVYDQGIHTCPTTKPTSLVEGTTMNLKWGLWGMRRVDPPGTYPKLQDYIATPSIGERKPCIPTTKS